jgi:hypothetical protein
MKKYVPLWLVVPVTLIIVGSFQNEARGQVQGNWNGTVSYVETTTGIGDFLREKKVHVVIRDNEATGTVTDHGKNVLGSTDCEGSGKAILAHVGINYGDSTYTLHVMSPGCMGTSFSKLNGETSPFGPEITDIAISDKPLRSPNVLAGTETRTADIVPGSYTATITTTWSLSRTMDVELIVTPADYDNWLPKPGRDELTKGSVMNIALKVRSHNGQPSALKAKKFEIRLSNTSNEPGITLNAPLSPSPKQLPDLRLLPPLAMAESIKEDQFISIPCTDGATGKVNIGSYDGGGWTTLTAEAILEDDTRIKGNLLVSGGETEIPVPKRNPGSLIATTWLTANGNPGEMEDQEFSKDNSNNGDGFTAYEEYRGVISQGRFKRLDPKKKEVGIEATQTDFSLFNEGVGWFKNASDLEPVRFDFDKDEIGPDGKLNMNVKTSHDYDQYAIYILNGGLGGDGTLGITYSRRRPSIPANDIGVVIDWDYIQQSYLEQMNASRPGTLKFTLREYLAQTVAHELGHAVNIRHHGSDNPKKMLINPDDRIIYRNGNLMTPHPDTLRNIGDSDGTVEGGNISCMLNYYPYFAWGHTIDANGVKIFNQEPLLPLGRIFCKSEDGTDINATKLYFGKAAKGNCLGQIQLKN